MKLLRATIAAMSAEKAASLPSAGVYRPTESEILRAVDACRRTGRIPEMLRPYYNQNGYWIGESRAWSPSTRRAANEVMRGLRLSAHEVVASAGEGGIVLNTSYVSRSKMKITIPYQEIRGSCIASTKGILRAPDLRRVMGNFVCETRKEVDLPALRQVDGAFRVPYSHILKLPFLAHVGGSVTVREYGLPALETVGGRLYVRFSEKVDAVSLVHVGKSIIAPICQCLKLPALRFVGGNLHGSFICNRIDAPKLKVVGGHFNASDARLIHARSLEIVGLDIHTRRCRHFYPPRLKVGGFWDVHPEAARTREIEEAARKLLRDMPGMEI
jgi:hypothetical protein